MLQFDFHNCMAEEIGEVHGLTEAELEAALPLVKKAHQQIQSWRKSGDAAFFELALQPQNITELTAAAEKVRKNFDDVVVLGIGGSSLGLGALSQALLPLHFNVLSREERGAPRLWICSNLDPDTFVPLMSSLNPHKTQFVVISKSGRTTETLAQFFVVVEKLKASVGQNWKQHFTLITDPNQGPLRLFAMQEGIQSFSIPPQLGGRYSLFSPVGLFPAACAGILVEDLLSGCREAALQWQSGDLEENPVYLLALLHFLLDQKKHKSTAVLFPYKDNLSTFADWYIQLWAESLGKGGKGSTPHKALGAVDQHSQLQLFMDGPNDKVFTFIGVDEFLSEPEETQVSSCMAGFDELTGHSFGEILQAEQLATTQALTKQQRPNMTITLPELSCFTLGQLCFAYELATAFAGALYGVNPFDQPGVELSKQLTKQILSGED